MDFYREKFLEIEKQFKKMKYWRLFVVGLFLFCVFIFLAYENSIIEGLQSALLEFGAGLIIIYVLYVVIIREEDEKNDEERSEILNNTKSLLMLNNVPPEEIYDYIINYEEIFFEYTKKGIIYTIEQELAPGKTLKNQTKIRFNWTGSESIIKKEDIEIIGNDVSKNFTITKTKTKGFQTLEIPFCQSLNPAMGRTIKFKIKIKLFDSKWTHNRNIITGKTQDNCLIKATIMKVKIHKIVCKTLNSTCSAQYSFTSNNNIFSTSFNNRTAKTVSVPFLGVEKNDVYIFGWEEHVPLETPSPYN